jgi:hypothetical protein
MRSLPPRTIVPLTLPRTLSHRSGSIMIAGPFMGTLTPGQPNGFRQTGWGVPGLSTFFENAAIHGEMWLVDCTGPALRLFQQRRRWNRRMINEDAKISHTFRA